MTRDDRDEKKGSLDRSASEFTPSKISKETIQSFKRYWKTGKATFGVCQYQGRMTHRHSGKKWSEQINEEKSCLCDPRIWCQNMMIWGSYSRKCFSPYKEFSPTL